MTSVLVDSNIFLDMFQGGPASAWSRSCLVREGSVGALVVNPVIWSEISVRFRTEADLAESLEGLAIHKAQIPYEAAFAAGKAHLAYRQNGGSRDRTLPDFLIGAHAQVAGHRLLTRDATRYRGYFPDLDIIAPDTHP
ncbi:type II toxin-antitoxin system VapC family toxin [Aminobacter sp. BE322]|uniref:type II toxin-antitoxin system VapC family toxin n=1 Tax=unclassified Aminobacter TaxID=2644704 RepID=UPI003D1B2E4B